MNFDLAFNLYQKFGKQCQYPVTCKSNPLGVNVQLLCVNEAATIQ